MNSIDRNNMVRWLVKKLLHPDREMTRKQVDELVEKNNLILGTVNPGFSHENFWFERGGRIVPNLGWEPALHERLYAQADGVAVRWKQLETDVVHIEQVFKQLTERCETWQDFRDALPDCVIQFESNLRAMERTRHESYFQGRRTTRFSYEMILPRLHTYAAMHLLI